MSNQTCKNAPQQIMLRVGTPGAINGINVKNAGVSLQVQKRVE